ncbi:MAG: hypothetical protein JKY65_00700, partial [Planctomycetes bacterium]|nr:hypothetical protein [Planctomycetota bacterium]
MIALKVTSIALVLCTLTTASAPCQRTEELRLSPPERLASGSFGGSTVINGEWAVVGDPEGSPTLGPLPGVVVVYRRTPQGWKQWQVLMPTNLQNNESFGARLAMSGTELVVGALSGGPAHRGRAYTYSLEGDTWVPGQVLRARDAADGDFFGSSVAIEGDTLVVGASGHATPYSTAGACYVYTREPQGWTLSDFILAPDPQTLPNSVYHLFGQSCDLDGDLLVVGTYTDAQGMAFVYRRTASGWVREGDLSAPQFNPQIQMQLGYSVSISGNTVAVGAPVGVDPFSGGGPTSVFMFDYDPVLQQWQQSQMLRASDSNLASPRDLFGHSVFLSGDRLVVGAPYGAFNGLRAGTAYIFERDAGVWSEVERMVASDPNDALHPSGAQLGKSVSLDSENNRILIGAPHAWIEEEQRCAGKAYFYDLNQGTVACGGFTNSLAQETRLTVTGNRTAANANVALSVYDAPPGKFGIFVAGPGGTQTPFGSAGASLCVGQ